MYITMGTAAYGYISYEFLGLFEAGRRAPGMESEYENLPPWRHWQLAPEDARGTGVPLGGARASCGAAQPGSPARSGTPVGKLNASQNHGREKTMYRIGRPALDVFGVPRWMTR